MKKRDVFLRLPHDVARWMEAHPEIRPSPLVEQLLRSEAGYPPVRLRKRSNHRVRVTAVLLEGCKNPPARIRAVLLRWLEREKRRH